MKKSIYYLLPFLGLSLFYTEYSNAACAQNPLNNQIRYIPNDTIYLQYDNLTSNNTVLKSHTITGFTSGYGFGVKGKEECGGYIDNYFLNGWSVSSNNTAPTNISGIGIRVRFNGGYLPTRSTTASMSWGYTGTVNWTVDIVKTGMVSLSGTIRSGDVAIISQYNTIPKTRFVATRLRFQSNYRINVLSCSLKNSQSVYNIELGDWYDTQFANMGDTSTAVDIPITLTCMSGANIKATITSSAGYVDVNTGKLALSGADKATGIAIQLLDKNSVPIKLNTKNSLQNSVPAGDYMFNWKARYIKTADKITPGSANSTATVNIRYE
ncbi:fimbrial protein [Providencia sp. PROV202]|uniref:fimbrial protein n=1 Tax=Providencia sp. PROV202 TaxID=2949902 RepID=UPI002349BB07|nr:fimbrial protein [Providencia sp. PROV202]